MTTEASNETLPANQAGVGVWAWFRMTVRRLGPGLILAVVIATAARFAADHNGGPPMVYALALGVSLGAIASDDRCRPGLSFANRQLVRAGIVCLGLTFSIPEIVALGPWTIAATLGCVATAVCGGLGIARLFGLRSEIAFLTACATSICGATAALAVSCILPASAETDRAKGLIVGTIALISTATMLTAPAMLAALGASDTQSGFFLGATIADVAQVISAGYSINPDAGRAATLVKLLRVACLAPVVISIGMALRRAHSPERGVRPALVPRFMLVFAGFVVLNSFGIVPADASAMAGDLSHWCLLTSIAALGVQTVLRNAEPIGGWRIGGTIVVQTVVLMSLAATCAAIAM